MSEVKKVFYRECYKYPTFLNPNKFTLDSEFIRVTYKSGDIKTFANRICLPKKVKKFMVERTRKATKNYGSLYMVIDNIYE